MADQISTLHTIIELSLVLLGFSGAVVAFGGTPPKDWTGINRVRISTLVAVAMTPFTVSAILLVLIHAEMEQKLAIQFCSAATAVVITFVALRLLVVHLRASKDDPGRIPLMLLLPLQALLYSVAILQVWNVLFVSAFWPFLTAMVAMLSQGTYIFAQLLFRPLSNRTTGAE